jgi:hypothetical protein
VLFREPWLRQARHFSVYTGDFDRQLEYSARVVDMPNVFRRSFAEVLRPALKSARRCRLYDLRWLTDQGGHRDAQIRYPEGARERWRATHFRASSGGTEVDLHESGVMDDIDFWWWLIGSGAKPVFVAPRADVDFTALFARCFDPYCTGNLGSSVPKAAIDFARRTADDDMVALLPRRGSDRGTLTIFASSAEIVGLFARAIRSAKLSEGYLARENALLGNAQAN